MVNSGVQVGAVNLHIIHQHNLITHLQAAWTISYNKFNSSKLTQIERNKYTNTHTMLMNDAAF